MSLYLYCERPLHPFAVHPHDHPSTSHPPLQTTWTQSTTQQLTSDWLKTHSWLRISLFCLSGFALLLDGHFPVALPLLHLSCHFLFLFFLCFLCFSSAPFSHIFPGSCSHFNPCLLIAVLSSWSWSYPRLLGSYLSVSFLSLLLPTLSFLTNTLLQQWLLLNTLWTRLNQGLQIDLD